MKRLAVSAAAVLIFWLILRLVSELIAMAFACALYVCDNPLPVQLLRHPCRCYQVFDLIFDILIAVVLPFVLVFSLYPKHKHEL